MALADHVGLMHSDIPLCKTRTPYRYAETHAEESFCAEQWQHSHSLPIDYLLQTEQHALLMLYVCPYALCGFLPLIVREYLACLSLHSSLISHGSR